MDSSQMELWERASRGRELQFFATDDELYDWLMCSLPGEFQPYFLLGQDRIEEGRTYRWEAFDIPLADSIRSFRERPRGRYIYNLRSRTLTPDLRLTHQVDVSRLCTLNGLICIEHGFVHRGKQDPSRISLVDRVRSVATGEVIHSKGYLTIYRALKRQIRARLTYATVMTFPDGSELEDRDLCLMTQDAVEAYSEGWPFKSRPGQQLTE